MENQMIHVKINGIPVEVPEGSTILDAAKAANVEIPTLCYLKDVNCIGACRICVVEATGARGLVAACTHPVSEGMEVQTNTPKVRASRKTTVEKATTTVVNTAAREVTKGIISGINRTIKIEENKKES